MGQTSICRIKNIRAKDLIKMPEKDAIALGAFILSLILALSAFIYWLVNVSYKINRFIFDLENKVDEIKEHSKQYDNYFRDLKHLIAILNRRLDYLKHIITLEYPQYFKKKNDETNN